MDTLWVSSLDVANHMYWACASMLKFHTFFLPKTLFALNPLVGKGKAADTTSTKESQTLTDYQRKMYGLIMASCGVWNDR